MILTRRAICVVLLLSMINVTTKSGGACKCDRPQQVIFAKRAKDYILAGPIVTTKLVSSDQECQMQCILSMKCDMFNLGPLDDSFRHTCQILRFDFKNYVVQRKKGWSFRARKCSSSPCKNRGVCFSTDEAKTPQCACPSDWTGRICSEPTECRSDDGWIKYDNFCYKLFTDELKFAQANISCISSGASLVSIEDFDELDFLNTVISKDDKIFVGMTDIAEEDRWVWMDGSAVTLDPMWHGEHPDGGTAENCGEYQGQHGFHDIKCTEKRQFVCKYSLHNL